MGLWSLGCTTFPAASGKSLDDRGVHWTPQEQANQQVTTLIALVAVLMFSSLFAVVAS
jgi:ABC-type transport system involved in cytochrome c biogenesis permease subunit